MKKKIIFLSSLMVATNLGTVVSCSQPSNSQPPIVEPKPIIPNSYDLRKELLILNQLDFKKQNGDSDLNQVDFLNCWFLNFEPLNSKEVNFEGIMFSEIERKIQYSSKTYIFENKTDQIAKWVPDPWSTKLEFEYQNYNKILSMPIQIDVNQSFKISSELFYPYFRNASILNLSANASLSDSRKEISTYPPQELLVEPWALMAYSWESYFFLAKMEGLFQFNLAGKTEIAYLVENKTTHEKTVYSYQVNDLIKSYQNDNEYQKNLSDEQGIFYYDGQKDFKLQLPVLLEMVVPYFLTVSNLDRLN